MWPSQGIPVYPFFLALQRLWRYVASMSRVSDAKKQKKLGRPPVDGEAVNVRLERRKLAELDDWRREQPDLPNRPEAMRRLMALGMTVKRQ